MESRYFLICCFGTKIEKKVSRKLKSFSEKGNLKVRCVSPTE